MQCVTIYQGYSEHVTKLKKYSQIVYGTLSCTTIGLRLTATSVHDMPLAPSPVCEGLQAYR